MSLTADPAATLYIQLPDVTPQRVLIPCVVKEEEGAYCTVETPEGFEAIHVDATVLTYFDQRQTFVQQPARVRAVEAAESGMMLEIERLGEPVNAEQRQVFRVSCINAPISATMHNEADCKVVDISATGFGVQCESHFHIGSSVTAQVHWDGETIRGPVVVVSVRQLPNGKNRYGVRSVENGEAQGMNLRRSLTRISLAVQREQMRRIQQ